MRSVATSTALLSTCFILAAGCSLESSTPDQEEAATQSESAVTVAATRLDLTRPNAAAGLTTIKSLGEFRSFFGARTAVPAGVDFSRGDWVLHYSAGPQPTGGFDAALAVDLDTRRNVLVVTEALSKPGSHCTVTPGKTTPQAAARIAGFRGPRVPAIQSKKVSTMHDCAVECPSNPDTAVTAPSAGPAVLFGSDVGLFGRAANACSWFTGTLIVDVTAPRDTVHLEAGHRFDGSGAESFPESSEANCKAWKETVIVYRGGDASNGFANTRIAEKTRTGHWANGQCSDQDGRSVSQFADFPVPRPAMNQDWYVLAIDSKVGDVTLPVELAAILDP